MLFEKVSRIINRRSRDKRRTCLKDISDVPITDIKTGFIQHRRGFPLECKRLSPANEEEQSQDNRGNAGLLFESDKYLEPGTAIEATITLKGGTEKIRGKVVMVRDRGDYYEIGLWLGHQAEASRARIVEQTCYIEEYIKEKKFREGPFIINREDAAEEWISKYAAGVPGN